MFLAFESIFLGREGTEEITNYRTDLQTRVGELIKQSNLCLSLSIPHLLYQIIDISLIQDHRAAPFKSTGFLQLLRLFIGMPWRVPYNAVG